MEDKLITIATVIGAIFTVIAVIVGIMQLLKKNRATIEMKQLGIANKQTIDNSNHSFTINTNKEKE